MSVFGFIVPGRLVQQAEQVPNAPTQFAGKIEEAQDLNHLTVFLTGVAPLPDGYGATIHLELPGKGWQLIGALSNTKPSAIFRLRGTFTPSAQASSFTNLNPTDPSIPNAHLLATLGILCEPLSSVEAQLAALGPSKAEVTATSSSSTTEMVLARSNPPDMVVLAQKVGLNAYNAISSFAQPLPDGSGSWIEMGVVEKWYKNFEQKLKARGIAFLMSD